METQDKIRQMIDYLKTAHHFDEAMDVADVIYMLEAILEDKEDGS